MDSQHFEVFGKKVAMFYHPLFRKTIEAWSSAFAPSSKHINMIIFIELNVRIQKAMIYPADTVHSMNSALTDWYQKLEDISLREKKPSATLKTQTKFSLPDVSALFSSISFEPCQTQEQYNNFFKERSQHLAMKYANTFLSLTGLSKFVFDLCLSWCDTLDIELFVYFLNGLFLHITKGETLKTSSLRSIDEIDLFIEPFFNFFKMQKSHYQRYVKNTLNSFQPWCEWNYFRIKEIKGKLLENFLQAFPANEKQRILDIEQIFDEAHALIPENLKVFDIQTLLQFHADDFWGTKSNGASTEKEIIKKEAIAINSNRKPVSSSYNRSQRKEPEKISMPIIGKSLQKFLGGEGQTQVVKTIESVNFFMEGGGPLQDPGNEAIQVGLYPIWESEFSDCNSMISFRDYNQSFGNVGSKGFILDELKPKEVFSDKPSMSQKEEHLITIVDNPKIFGERSKTPTLFSQKTGDENGTMGPSKHQRSYKKLVAHLPTSEDEASKLNDPRIQMNRSLTEKMRVKPEVKRGGYAFTKRKQNFVPLTNIGIGPIFTEINAKFGMEKSLSTQSLADHVKPQGSKFIQRPVKPRQAPSKSREGRESSQTIQRKISSKKLVKAQLFNHDELSSTNYDSGFPLESSNGTTSVGRAMVRLNQLFAEEKRADASKLPKLKVNARNNKPFQIMPIKFDQIEAVGE